MFRRATCLVACQRHRKYSSRDVSYLSCIQNNNSSIKKAWGDTVFFSSMSLKQADVVDNTSNDSDAVSSSSTQELIKSLSKDERRKLNNERYNQAEERRRLHKQQMNEAATRKQINKRRILAEELMRIFATNDECFNITLQELNINRGGYYEGSKSNHLIPYRQFYMDSLKSFGKMIAEDIYDNEDGTLSQVGLSRETAINVLEHFDESLISKHTEAENSNDDNNPQMKNSFSKRYRKMVAMIQREAEEQANVKKYKIEYEQVLNELKVEEELLEKMESSENEPMMSALNEWEIDSEGDNYALELDRLEAALAGALSEVQGMKSEDKEEPHKQRNKVARLKAAVTKKANKISSIENSIEELEWPMSHDEYTSINDNIMKITTGLAPALAQFITIRHEDFHKYKNMESHTDLTKPHEWYPRARLDKRKIIFHAGPTNSGKTYNALQRLKKAERGMYLGPLRLLAAEVYEAFTSEGIYTDLLTGQEHREVPFSTHQSSTVELACLERDFDVVVIDEIQMLGNEFRGAAWTRALLGVRCKEIHVCGGAEAISIVKKMAEKCGDDFELHRYERFRCVND